MASIGHTPISFNIVVWDEPLKTGIFRLRKAEAIAAELIAEEITRASQRLVPIRTATLWKSIVGSSRGREFTVEYGAPYALYVELGTRHSAPQPYIIPAVNGVDLYSIVQQALYKAGVFS